MNSEKLSKIIDIHIERFINNISIELESEHDDLFDNFGFPIFGMTSKYYYEQVYYQSYLESYTRNLINGILKEIIDFELCDEVYWPEIEYKEIYKGFTNVEYEKNFGFEFINRTLEIGYRYTHINPEEINILLKKENVKSIKIVEWDDGEIVFYEHSDSRVDVISLMDLLIDIFNDHDDEVITMVYSLISKKLSEAVEHAKTLISLATVPGFTQIYIHNNRDRICKNLKKEIQELSRFFVKNELYKETETNSVILLEECNLHTRFIENHIEKAFVGKSSFAKSFMTSEYMYQYFHSNPLFDFTPIVSGYIKSIEQILDFISTSCRNNKNQKINMHSFTMGNYTEYIKSEPECFEAYIRPYSKYIIACLNSYRVECRNNLFHKDYFDLWDRVEMIRNNTIFLYVILLGAMNKTLMNKNYSALGIIDESYDYVFEEIDKLSDSIFNIRFKDKEFTDLRKKPRTQRLLFSKYGLIKNSITFYYLDNDYEKEVVISRNHMPDEICIVDIYGNKKRKIL